MKKRRFDGWKTLAKEGLGGVYDKAKDLHFKTRPELSRSQLNGLYKQNALVSRAVDLIVDESMKQPWAFRNIVSSNGSAVDGELLRKRLETLAPSNDSFDGTIGTAAKWSRLYGGSLLIIPTDDGRAPDKPLDINALRHIAPVVPVASYDAEPMEYDAALGSGTFRQVIKYQLILDQLSALEVHHSRLARFEPIRLPEEHMGNVGGLGASRWGHSIVERIYDDLAGYGASKGHSLAQMFVASLIFLKMTGYRKQQAEKGGRTLIRQLMTDFSALLSSQRVAPLDIADDVLTVQNTNTQASAITKDMRDGLGAVVDYPREIFFNESPVGLNAGELSGPQKIFFAKCDAYRTQHLEPQIRKVVDLAAAAWGTPLQSYEIEWPDLWTPSTAEVAETTLKNATSDKLYWDMGAVAADEVRVHRHEKGKDTPLEVGEEEEASPLDLSAGVEEPAEGASPPESPQPAAVLEPAQLEGLMAIVEKVTAGSIPRTAGVALVHVAYPAAASMVDALLGPALAAEPEQDSAAGPSSEPAPDDLMSPRDAAARLGIPTRAITLQIEQGALPFWGIGKHKRVSLADVMTLGKQHEQPAEDEDTSEEPEES